MFLEVVTALVVTWLLWYLIHTYQCRRNMPPGPFPLPLLGNTHQIGTDPPFSMDHLWKKYGDVYQVTFPIGTFVIINGFDAAREALVTRKDDFAGRPIDLMYPVDIITQGKSVASADYGLKFIFRKKIVKSALHIFGNNLSQVEERMRSAVKDLLTEIDETQGRPFSLKYYISAALTSQLWGWISSQRYRHGNETLQALIQFQEKMIFLMRQGSYFQMLPFMKFFPTKFTKTLKDVLKMREEIFGQELNEHLRTYNNEETRDIIDSLIFSYETEKKKTTVKDVGTVDDIKYLLLDAVVAGADTSITSVSWFMLYLVSKNIDQSKIHDELDKVVGPDRPPRWEDVKKLHYLQASVCEVMRITGFLPWMPHRTIRDTTVQGYHVPKNTSVFVNFYRIHRDPKVYSEPSVFNPDRFLNVDGTFNGWTALPAFVPFGVGRRACLGQDLGKLQVLSVVSSLLHQFTFDADNQHPLPSLDDGTLGSLRHPIDFKVIAKRRQ